MAKALKDDPIDHIYSSDLTRCRQTAHFLRVNHPKAVYHEVKEFREAHAGILGGKTLDKSMKSEIQSLGSLKQFFTHYGETMENVFSRVWTKLNQIAEVIQSRHESQVTTVAIISHGGPIRMILAKLLGYYPDRLNLAASEIKVSNCSITSIELEDDSWKLVEHNKRDHLDII